MSDEELEPRSFPEMKIMVGEELTHFSKEELTKRIVSLNEEIKRTELALSAKDTQASIAENLFKTTT